MPVTITSPNYPKFFTLGDHCVWLLKAPQSGSVYLQFIEQFQLQCEETCDKSYVEVKSSADFRVTGYRYYPQIDMRCSCYEFPKYSALLKSCKVAVTTTISPRKILLRVSLVFEGYILECIETVAHARHELKVRLSFPHSPVHLSRALLSSNMPFDLTPVLKLLNILPIPFITSRYTK